MILPLFASSYLPGKGALCPPSGFGTADIFYFAQIAIAIFEINKNNPNPYPTGKIWLGLYCFGAPDRT